MARIDPERWAALSPRLDELLDLPAEARAARLAAWRSEGADGPALADELAALLAEHEALEAGGFLAGGAMPPPPPLAGQAVGAYTLDRLLGEGGMGQVWLARRTDGRFEGEVAIKLLRGGLRSAGDSERFAAEGRILARLDQPHIARLLDAGVTGDGATPYLVLEYVDGEPIDDHVERLDLPLERRLRLMIDAAEAVAHAHARLILHRDLKPSNMLVRRDGELKLLDFGIAKLLDETGRGGAGEVTQRAGQAYTPKYAAPEQLQGEDVTTATDVYALGVLLYELLGGGHPTAPEAGTPLDDLRAAVEREPRRLSDQVRRRGGPDAARLSRALRGDLDTIVARALKKKPAERYANAAELAADLRRTLAHEPIQARPDRWHYRSAKFVRRHRLAVGAAAVALVSVLGGAAVALQEAREARARRGEVESLLEFMLGDLRKRLQPVGRLDVLDAVGARALSYYAAQDASRLDADALARRARALHLIGEIAERRGQLDEAARRFESAAQTTAELLARAPADRQRVFEHSQSEYWVGFVARRRGELEQAEAAMQRYLDLASRLEPRPGDPPDWALEAAFARQSLGVIRLERGRPADALRLFEDAASALTGFGRTRPEVMTNAAVVLGWVSRAREALGRLPGALAAQEEKLAVLQAAGAAPDDPDARYEQAVALAQIASLQVALGRAEGAVPPAQRALAMLQALSARDPANLDWLAQSGSLRLQLAEALLANGRRGEARGEVESAQTALAPLWRTDSQKLYWQVKLRGRLLLMQARAGVGAETLRSDAEAFVAAAERARQARGGLDTDQSLVLAEVLLLLGDLERGEAPASATARWQAALGLAAPPSGHGELTASALVAHARLRLGDAQAAAAMAEKLDGTPYRHPLRADLRRRLESAGGAGSRR